MDDKNFEKDEWTARNKVVILSLTLTVFSTLFLALYESFSKEIIAKLDHFEKTINELKDSLYSNNNIVRLHYITLQNKNKTKVLTAFCEKAKAIDNEVKELQEGTISIEGQAKIFKVICDLLEELSNTNELPFFYATYIVSENNELLETEEFKDYLAQQKKLVKNKKDVKRLSVFQEEEWLKKININKHMKELSDSGIQVYTIMKNHRIFRIGDHSKDFIVFGEKLLSVGNINDLPDSADEQGILPAPTTTIYSNDEEIKVYKEKFEMLWKRQINLTHQKYKAWMLKTLLKKQQVK